MIFDRVFGAPYCGCAPRDGTRGDTLTAVYQLALHYESGNWESVDGIARRAGIEPSAFRDAYCKAVCWADETLADLP